MTLLFALELALAVALGGTAAIVLGLTTSNAIERRLERDREPPLVRALLMTKARRSPAPPVGPDPTSGDIPIQGARGSAPQPGHRAA